MKTRVIILSAIPALVLISAILLIPTRITYGAGSLRCGTAFRPTTDAEMGPRDCVEVGQMRIADSFKVALVLLVLSGIGVVSRVPSHRPKWLRGTINILYGFLYFIVISIAVFFLTGAYSLD